MKEWFEENFYEIAIAWDDAVYKIGMAILYYLIPVCVMGAGALVFHILGLDMYVDWPAIRGSLIVGCIIAVWWIILDGVNTILSKLWDKLMM